jgi:hypothetical protein
METEPYLYPWSREEAVRRGELTLWQESRDANISCRKAIEAAISEDYDGQALHPNSAKVVINGQGYKRTAFVLANTVRHLNDKSEISAENVRWANAVHLPPEKNGPSGAISAANPSEAINAFIDEYRAAVQELGLFDYTHCERDSKAQDFTGKVLVLSPNILKESCWKPTDQLWYAHDGFGCSPDAIGRSIRCECLGDGEQTRWNRHDFVGVLKDEFLPDWARERLAQLTGQEQTDAPEMGGMTMN